MPKLVSNGLSPPKVKAAKPGRYADGDGLYLFVKASDDADRADAGRFWIFRYKLAGRSREMGLGRAGGVGAVSLAAAREEARRQREFVQAGVDPIDERDRLAAEAAAAKMEATRAKTFREVAALYIEANGHSWRNAKHRAQWSATLEAYAYPEIGDRPIAEVGTDSVLAILEPIWPTKPETASRVRGRIETVLDYAKARGWRTGENPARWRGHVASMLPARSKVARVVHHAAIPWQEIGDFMAQLRERPAVAARALEFAILTAARTGETIGARWREIDLDAGLWVVPGERMKAGREHRVALSKAAVTVLKGMKPLRPENDREGEAFVFPGQRGALSSMAMLMLLRRMDRPDLTAHGFRSTFRDWVAETTAYPRDLAEMALAHSIGDKVEAAYRRGDMVAKRRRMMEDWADHCAKPSAKRDNVTPIRKGAA